MERHFHDDLDELKQLLLKMGLNVQEAIHRAVQALVDLNDAKSEEVFRNENAINQAEIEIDKKGHRLLALEQPVAIDLRRITMFLKMNSVLERMGDHAVNIAGRAKHLMSDKNCIRGLPIDAMAEASKKMVKLSLDAFVKEDYELARQVLEYDDVVDEFNRNIRSQIRTLMEKDSSLVGSGIHLIMAAYDLERIGDLASNIAEDVIYIQQGKEVRHHTK